MSYNPKPEAAHILDRAWYYVNSVSYRVTARWVFYRLLQEGIYNSKAGYKHLLSILSKARKEFYSEWRPWTLADDSRAPILMQRSGYYTLYMRGSGFTDETDWIQTLNKELNCPLDRWATQPYYLELWFEAAAMQSQFLHYANENVPLLAFHGDVSIPEKWRCAQRLADWWLKYQQPIYVYYYGDYDPKGLVIPRSAWTDVESWTHSIIRAKSGDLRSRAELHFVRVGINTEQIDEFHIPENPERPGTYQWEALDDESAQVLIERAHEMIDEDAFAAMMDQESDILNRFKARMLDGDHNE